MLLGILGLIIMIMTLIAFGGGQDATWEDLNWSAVLLLVALQLLFMTTGVVLFRWEHYWQSWQERTSEKQMYAAENKYSIAAENKAERDRKRKAKEWEKLQKAKESYQKNQLAKQMQQTALEEAEQRKAEEQQKLLELPRFPGSQHATLYLNRHAGVMNYIWCVVFIGMALGSLLTIPLMVEYCKEQTLLLATVGIIILFWIGFVGSIFSRSVCKGTSVEAYALTNEGILYRISFSPMKCQNRAITKLGAAIEDYKYIWESSKLRDEQKAYLHSEAAEPMVEQAINEGASLPLRGRLIRLNFPRISRRGISGVKVRYWDEVAERWKKVVLLRSNEGYDKICQVIQKKMECYDTSERHW